jgi:hypothetical protein
MLPNCSRTLLSNSGEGAILALRACHALENHRPFSSTPPFSQKFPKGFQAGYQTFSRFAGAGLRSDHQPKPAMCEFFFASKCQHMSAKHQHLAGAGIRAGINK